MAENKKVEIDLLVNTAESAKSVSDIKRSLKDLKAAALEFGEGSEGFRKATAAAGQLNDKLADVNGSIKVLSGNTTENLTRSFSGVAQAGVGGFQAVMGAQALFGEKNKDLQEQLVKLQGVMNFANGLKEFANIGQAAKDFKLVLLSLIGTKVTETAVTETNTVVTTQNVASKEASAIASTALAIQNGIASAATSVLTTITTAFGVASGVAWAIATGGIILLVAAIVGLIVYFDDIKAKVDEFGIAGKIALGLILGPLYLLYEGLKMLGEYFGVLDTETEKSAERRAEAETKYKDKVEENYKKINAAQREADVASGKITQANADRQEAKETFITNFKKAQIDARLAYEQSAGAEEDAVIKKNLDLQIKAISLEYSNKLVEIRKGEKKLADEALKTTQEKNNKIAEKNKAAGEKTQKSKEEEAQKLKQLELKYIDETEYEKIDRLEKAELEIAKKLNASEEVKKNIRKKFSEDRKALLDKETEAEFNVMVAAGEAEQKITDDKANRLNTFTSTLIASANARLTEEEKILNDGNNRKLELQKQFDALSADEKITRQKQLDDEIIAINQETNVELDKLAQQQLEKDRQLQSLKLQGVSDGLSAISSLTELFAGKSREQQRKAFNIQKGVSIAQAGIATFESATKAFNSLAGIPVVGPVLGGVAAAAAVAAGLVNIKKISSQKFDGGGDNSPASNVSGGGGAASSASGGIITPPTFNLGGQQIGGASNILGSNNIINGQQPVKVYVSETDISSTQNKVNVIQGNSLFGG